jgi:hypothetical protein
MGNPTLRFQFAEPDARADADALAEFVRDDAADWSLRVLEENSSPEGTAQRSIDWQLVSTVTAVVQGVGAMFNPADRAKLRERLAQWTG